MTSSAVLSIALAVSLTLSTILVAVLAKPLRLVLSTLCERGEGIPFWVAFISLMLYLAPLFITIVRQGGAHLEFAPVAEVVRMSLSTAVLGAFVALLPVAWQIARARPRPPAATAQSAANEIRHEVNRG